MSTHVYIYNIYIIYIYMKKMIYIYLHSCIPTYIAVYIETCKQHWFILLDILVSISCLIWCVPKKDESPLVVSPAVTGLGYIPRVERFWQDDAQVFWFQHFCSRSVGKGWKWGNPQKMDEHTEIIWKLGFINPNKFMKHTEVIWNPWILVSPLLPQWLDSPDSPEFTKDDSVGQELLSLRIFNQTLLVMLILIVEFTTGQCHVPRLNAGFQK